MTISRMKARVLYSSKNPKVSMYYINKFEELDSLTTDKQFRYIGKTKDLIFFFNRRKKETMVFKMERIKEINIDRSAW